MQTVPTNTAARRRRPHTHLKLQQALIRLTGEPLLQLINDDGVGDLVITAINANGDFNSASAVIPTHLSTSPLTYNRHRTGKPEREQAFMQIPQLSMSAR